MSAQRRFDKASRLTSRVMAETRLVIGQHALWSTLSRLPCRPDSPAAAAALPILRSALRGELAMALSRLFETGQRDAATFPRILRIVEDPAVSDLLGDHQAAERASASHARVQTGGTLKRLRTFRDRVLAHNDMRAADVPLAAEDIGTLVEAAAGLAAELGRALGGDEPPSTAGLPLATINRTTEAKMTEDQSHAEESRYQRGERTLASIDGEAGKKVIASLADIAPDFARFLVEFPFGDIYSRPGLGLREREIATVAALTAMGNAAPQLKVHIGAALNVGLSRQEIVEIIMQMAVYAGFPAALNGLAAAREVFAERDAG